MDAVSVSPRVLPQVGVVVTHYEQPVQLARTLHALLHQTYPQHLLDVVVADDGSQHRPVVPAGMGLTRQPHRGFGAARARNAGARQVKGDVLVFLDADTTPEPDFVERITARPAALPEAVVVGRRRHARLPEQGDVAVTGPKHELPEPAWLADGYRRTADLRLADETSFRFVISAVLSCHRWFFELTGGFDTSFTAYGGEDWEWAHRAWTQGAVLVHEPRAVAWHDGPAREPERRLSPGARARFLAETIQIAGRVPVEGVAPTGLLTPGAADPLVTVEPGINHDALVVTVDSVLAALPRALVLLSAPAKAVLPDDPRLAVATPSPLTGPGSRSAWRRLHLRRAVAGDRLAWAAPGDLLRGPAAPGRVLVDREGELLAEWSTLRAERRAARGNSTELDPCVRVDAPWLRLVGDDVTAQAWWGGWA